MEEENIIQVRDFSIIFEEIEKYSEVHHDTFQLRALKDNVEIDEEIRNLSKICDEMKLTDMNITYHTFC